MAKDLMTTREAAEVISRVWGVEKTTRFVIDEINKGRLTGGRIPGLGYGFKISKIDLFRYLDIDFE